MHAAEWIQLGQLGVGVIGLFAIYWQISNLSASLKAQALSFIYDQYFQICHAVLKEPELRPHLYDGVPIPSNGSAQLHRKVATLCELMTGLLEHAVAQKKNLPRNSWDDCWAEFLKEMYPNLQAPMTSYYKKYWRFYTKDFRDIVETQLKVVERQP
jgi:hypothetical protein